MNILLIDNMDSFVHNLADEFARIGCQTTLFRNQWDDSAALDYIEQHQPEIIVFSPGPGHPKQDSLCRFILAHTQQSQKILGICLGHQIIVDYFGGTVAQASSLMHGRASFIQHDQQLEFQGLPNPLQVARYHSLVATSLSDELITTAVHENTIMAVRHRTRPIVGLQFHPESVLTPEGSLIIQNYLEAYHAIR
ncbi:MAG: aminodeoxychorismate/anthranilate synthase component II [Legionellales bacterium]|nr:aminodeoxychorismate/anthranilate synthase component II [Legionellales bacterium]